MNKVSIGKQPSSTEHVLEELLVSRKEDNNILYWIWKRIFDIAVSLVIIVALVPVFILIALLIWLEDRGPVFYKQERVGKKGKTISLIKFRSMVQNAGNLEELLSKEQIEEYYKEYKIKNDPRITKVGKFLRVGFDELPQLLLILKGDLSFVGPRPLVKQELEDNYGMAADIFTSVTPGLTGYWQAYAHHEATYENQTRQKMELYYIFNCSAWFDIKIFFRTIKRVLFRK